MKIFAPYYYQWNSNTAGVLFSDSLSVRSMQTIPVFDTFFCINHWLMKNINLPEVKKCNQ